MYILYLLSSFFLGAALGSFLNVLIDRLSTGRGFLTGRSYCEHCKKTLRPIDLIPLFSYLSLRGKCRFCHAKIPLRLFVVEFLTGILAVIILSLVVNQVVSYYSGFLLFLTFFVYLGIFVADVVYGIIPDLLVIFSVIFIFLLLIVTPAFLSPHFLAGIGTLLFFLSLFAITKGRGMGFGDVKLAFSLGFFLGFPNIIVALYLAFLTGAGVSIILVIWQKVRFSGGTIPFGPFLVASAIIAYFWGEQILSLFLTRFF